MHALGILPLIQRSSVDVNQVWYVDDAAATGTVLNLKEWWDDINNFGPSYGYYANAKKTWLVVKEAHYTSAFHGTNLNITTTGKPHLGAPLGTQSFVTQYVKDKIDNWPHAAYPTLLLPSHMQHIPHCYYPATCSISHIATTQPHAAYPTLLLPSHMQHIPHCYYPATCSISHIATTQPHAAYPTLLLPSHMQHIPHCYYPATCSISHIATTQPHAAYPTLLLPATCSISHIATTSPCISHIAYYPATCSISHIATTQPHAAYPTLLTTQPHAAYPTLLLPSHMQHIPHCYYPATCCISHIATTQPHAAYPTLLLPSHMQLFCIATTQPHAAYSAFTHGLVHKWSYLARTVPDITRLFQPFEDVIRTKFIPCLTGRAPPNDLERNLLSLPPRLGGLGIPNPTTTSDTEYTASRSVCKSLYNLILLHDSSYPTKAIEQQVKAKKEVHSFKLKHSQGSASNLVPSWLTPLNAQWI
eukprot:Em0004g67a